MDSEIKSEKEYKQYLIVELAIKHIEESLNNIKCELDLGLDLDSVIASFDEIVDEIKKLKETTYY